MTKTIPFDHQTNSFVHQVLLTVAWTALINVSLIIIQFKSKRIFFIIHFILGVSVIILTLLGPLIFLIEHGIKFNSKSWYKETHNIIGFITFCVILLQGFIGYLIKRSQQKQFLAMNNIKNLKLIHKIFGLILIILAKSAYMLRYANHWQFIPLLTFQGLSIFILIIIKVKQKKIISNFEEFNPKILKTITTLKQLKDFQQFFIIGNRMYSIFLVKKFHPGGVSIINQMKGRQIDRFLFGCAGPESAPHLKFQHPKQTLRILKQPLAKLSFYRTYLNMKQINSCKLISLNCLNNGQTFLIKLGLDKCQDNVFFLGYSKFEQFGYYHSLSLNEEVTRLYTGVNCLRNQNIQRIKEILNLMKITYDFNLKYQQTQIKKDKPNIQINKLKMFQNNQQKFLNQTLLSCQSFSESGSRKDQFYVPLLIKKYQNGKFTSKLFYKNHKKQLNLQLSEPLGKGLGLEELQIGKIIFLAGGTGLFPFIDLIDILFKIDIRKRMFYGSQNLQNFDPILSNTESKAQNFQYVLILTLRNLSDIHPFTLFQINHLCGQQSTMNFVCKLKCPKDQARLSNQICNILQCYDVISETISSAKRDNCQKIYICGPPTLQKQAIQRLNQEQTLKHQYQIV